MLRGSIEGETLAMTNASRQILKRADDVMAVHVLESLRPNELIANWHDRERDGETTSPLRLAGRATFQLSTGN